MYQAAGQIEQAKKAFTTGLIYNSKDPQILSAIENLVNPTLVKPLSAIVRTFFSLR